MSSNLRFHGTNQPIDYARNNSFWDTTQRKRRIDSNQPKDQRFLPSKNGKRGEDIKPVRPPNCLSRIAGSSGKALMTTGFDSAEGFP